MSAEKALSTSMGGHALVIGGSMAGLLAGRVLADHFERVTIIERDRYPEGPAPRKGVPQARHQHVMLKRGMSILEKLLPGLRDELITAGAPSADMAKDIAWLTPAGWGVRFPSDLVMLTCSRNLLEWGVRRRVAALKQVRFSERADVSGLLPSADGRGVAGVKARFRVPQDAAGASGEEKIHADLVVDASGRSSDAPRWLEALGYTPPEETVVNARLGYASRVYRRPDGFQAGWTGAYVQMAPPAHTRGGVIFPLEGGGWLITLAGTGGDYPPTDEAGFLSFARSLRSPILYDAIKDAEPLSPITGYRATENRMRHYEKLPRMPENFLVLGDAACAFNPVYAQGMTTAAVGAEALGESLDEQRRRRPEGDLGGLGRRFQKRLAKVNSEPWTLATGEDFRVRGVEGGNPDRATRMMHRYMDRVVSLTTENADVRLALLEAFNLIKPPTTLFYPSILARVLRQAIARRRAARKEITEQAMSAPSVVAQQK